MEKISQAELIGKTYSSYEKEIAELEQKRNGDSEVDEIIDHMQEMPKAKLKTLELMFEIETGKKMFVD